MGLPVVPAGLVLVIAPGSMGSRPWLQPATTSWLRPRTLAEREATCSLPLRVSALEQPL